MGRTFENRKQAIFARSDRLSKVFTRLGKDIVMAVKSGGPIPETNPALRRVIQNCRAENMPKDKIDAAIKRALGQDGESYDELIYEGYAPHGIPLIIVTATDNVNRTIANLRVHFNKCNGNLGATGSVRHMFRHMGVFRLDPTGVDRESLELELIDAGLEDMFEETGEKGEPLLVIRCAFNDFGQMQSAIESRGLKVVSTASEYVAGTKAELTDEQEADVIKLIDRLENDDDVQFVFHNLG